MNFNVDVSIPVFTVLIQGLLSFFSPCVLPLVPLYIGYLAGGMTERDENGQVIYPRRKVFFHTICFVVGISSAFFLLGLGFTALGQFFKNYGTWVARIGGMIMVMFGLYQLTVYML